jgi:GT2 family glycosyltransferase
MSIEKYEITVLISTYNDRDWVEKKLLEIKGQTAFERAEFIFIEPASPGKEREVFGPFCERHQNCRLLTYDKRVSLYEAWNLGWAAAVAPLVCISNMDDTMHPELLERVLISSRQDQWEVASVLIAKQSVGAGQDTWGPARLAKLELSTRPGPFFVWKRELKDSLGLFDTSFDYGADKDFWARVVHAGLKAQLIAKILYLYTKHPAQLSKIPAFKAKRNVDDERGKMKEASYVWPAFYTRKVRLVRFLSRLPFMGRRYIVDA